MSLQLSYLHPTTIKRDTKRKRKGRRGYRNGYFILTMGTSLYETTDFFDYTFLVLIVP